MIDNVIYIQSVVFRIVIELKRTILHVIDFADFSVDPGVNKVHRLMINDQSQIIGFPVLHVLIQCDLITEKPAGEFSGGNIVHTESAKLA